VEDLLAGYPVVVEFPVAWGEMDSFNHINNVYYFRYIENARLDYCYRLGFEMLEMKTGVGVILASVELRIRKPLTYPDTVRVGARITEVQADRFTMEHRIVSRQLAAVAAEGKGVIVTFDYGSGKKAPVPEEVRRRIAALEGRDVGTTPTGS
jgi:acyl-CoA thioester hydrolase